MKTAIPFDFVLETLHRLDPVVKPMFGCHAIYVREKIMMIVRRKDRAVHDNGVWIATTHEHHASLRKDLGPIRSIRLLGDSGWQNIAEDTADFEENVMKACELILKNDSRIGKIPKSRKKNR